MVTARDALPDDIAALKEALATERAKALEIAAELAVARARASEDSALIAQQKLRIAKLERQIYGQRSERSSRLIHQLALTFEELEADATEDELAAEQAVARTTTVRGFSRRRAERQTFPEHLPRQRVVIDPPTSCECCGGNRLRKLGEDVTRTLESVPRQWKVVETVRDGGDRKGSSQCATAGIGIRQGSRRHRLYHRHRSDRGRSNPPGNAERRRYLWHHRAHRRRMHRTRLGGRCMPTIRFIICMERLTSVVAAQQSPQNLPPSSGKSRTSASS